MFASRACLPGREVWFPRCGVRPVLRISRPLGHARLAGTAKGKVKEAAGKAKGDKGLEAEGKADQAGANIKKTGEDIKDKFKE